MNPDRNRDLDSDDEGAQLDSEGFVVPDEEEDEEEDAPAEPPRRQHKYTTANLQPERPWKRWCLFCLAMLVTIGFMVLISIFLQKLFDPPEDEDWSDDNVNVTDDDLPINNDNGGGLLPKTAGYINNVCAEDKLADSVQRQACEQICAPAIDCCDPYKDGGNSTCFQEQVAGCVTYSQCHVVQSTTNDPAHNELSRICHVDSLTINPQDCQLACEGLDCCYTETGSCLATNFQACLDYAPCQNLKLLTSGASGKYISTAPSTLEEECSDGKATCSRGCREATCCSDPNSDCYRDNFVACLTYATCNQYEQQSTTNIQVAPIHSRVPAAPDNLRNVCLQSYVDSNGPEECQAACEGSACCFAAGVESCFGDDPLGCTEYQGCTTVLS